MSQFGIYFAGRSIVLPGVYARVNADAMTPTRGAPSRAVAVLATAQGGAVGAATRITSLASVRDTLIAGVGAHLTELAMAPSGQVQGTGEVYFVRVNKAVAATLSLGDMSFTAVTAGKIGNSARVKRSTAVASAFDLHLEHQYLGLTESYLNIGSALEVTYVGVAGSPTVAVTNNGGVRTLTLVGSGTIAFTSDNIPTIDALVDEINASSEWTARNMGTLSNLLTADLTVAAPALVDGKAVLGIPAGRAAEIATEGSLIATATPLGGASSFTAGAWTYLASGTEGSAASTQDWVDALTIAADLDVTAVVIGTGDTTVLAAAKAHVESMSDAKNRKERILYCGPEKAGSKAALTASLATLATGLGGRRTVIVGAEPKLVTAGSTKVETYPAYYLAAMVAGMKAGNRPEMPLTHKQVSIFGTSYQYTVTDLEDLLAIGVMPIHYDALTGQYLITQGITSHTRDANVVLRKVAGMDIADYLNRIIRGGLARYIGTVGDVLTAQQILNTVTGILNAEVRSSTNPDGVLTPGTLDDGAAEPAFSDVEVVLDGFDLVGIRYRAHPVGEIAYITATAFLTPVRIVARQ
jgi:hypothetical protein